MPLSNPSPEEPQPSSSSPPQNFWNRILTSTPVILTVVATVLAGLSSSEMTWAQYHRALAAQNQSKAGDQWNFFQAKRIRGTNVEMTIDVLRALSETGPVDQAALQTAAERLLQELQRGEKAVNHLREVIGPAKGNLGSAGESLHQSVTRLQQTTRANVKQAETNRDRIRQELAKKEVQEALSYLGTKQLPRFQSRPDRDSRIQEAVTAISERRPESAIAPLLVQIRPEVLQEALETAEADVLAVENEGKPISDTLKNLAKQVQRYVVPARAFQRAVRDTLLTAADLPDGANKPLPEVHAALNALERTATAVKTAADELSNDFKAAQYGYTAQRYEREARCNQDAALIYELQVRKSSVTSELHRTRSKHYFYGMLAAQAGVTLASFSLALKRRNILWLLAALAGLGAVLFSVWVYLSR
jgi:hypothetical protein